MTTKLREILAGSNPVQILRALRDSGTLSELEPTLAELLMPIPKGYNHKDNLEHSFVVLQNSIDREKDGADLILRTAALFHDIGKPATRKFGAKGSVTFTNHDVVGAKMVKSILPKHGYTKAEIKQISHLVLMHMRSHTFKTGWTDSAVRRMITDAGSMEQLERLVVIFYADITTKSNDRKAGFHQSISSLSAEMEKVKIKDERRALRPALNGNEVAELMGLTPGVELGKMMKFLNKDENVGLGREEAIALLKSEFS